MGHLTAARIFANIRMVLPKTELVLYRDRRGGVPLLAWLELLPGRAKAKCRVRIERLAELGHELRRPEADYLRGGIHELRVQHMGVNLRMLYFFHGPAVAVLCQGFTKRQGAVPSQEIVIALRMKAAFESDPRTHTHEAGA